MFTFSLLVSSKDFVLTLYVFVVMKIKLVVDVLEGINYDIKVHNRSDYFIIFKFSQREQRYL